MFHLIQHPHTCASVKKVSVSVDCVNLPKFKPHVVLPCREFKSLCVSLEGFWKASLLPAGFLGWLFAASFLPPHSSSLSDGTARLSANDIRSLMRYRWPFFFCGRITLGFHGRHHLCKPSKCLFSKLCVLYFFSPQVGWRSNGPGVRHQPGSWSCHWCHKEAPPQMDRRGWWGNIKA